MTSLRFSIVFIVLASFCLISSLAVSPPKPQDVKITPEEDCLAAGGHCVHSSKCPPGKVSAEGKCPKQKHLGAVCCHSIHAPDETDCAKLAGECKVDCPSNLTVDQARNCSPGEVCCTLV